MKSITGPAASISAKQTPSNNPIGVTSIRLSREGESSPGVQRRSIPARVIAIIVARPDTMISAIKVQCVGATRASRNNASISANFAIKPDRGGSPARSRAQKMKPPPRIAIVPGMTTPTSLSFSIAPTYSSSKTGSAIPDQIVLVGIALDGLDDQVECADRQGSN